MRLTIARHDDPEGQAPYSVDLAPPGATIGRWPGNSLVLSDPSGRLCKIQAALRIRESACHLRNLSSMSRVCVNGTALGCEQDAVVQPGDEILIGDYRLRLQPAGQAAATPSAADGTAAAMQPVAQAPAGDDDGTGMSQAAAPGDGQAGENAAALPAPDVFADLLGPGTLPVGAPPDIEAAHPFDMASAAPRNHPDPLAMLAPAQRDPAAPQDADPLALFSAGPGEHAPHLLSDPSPTTLNEAPGLRDIVGGKDGDPPAAPRSPVHEGLWPGRNGRPG